MRKMNILKNRNLFSLRSGLFSKNLFNFSTKVLNNQNLHSVSSNYLRKSIHLNNLTKRTFANLPSHNKLKMPNLSPTMKAVYINFKKGNVVEWKKKEGDKVKAGDTIASIETDKATVDFEVQEEGYLAKIMVPAGTKEVVIGQLVAIMVDEKADVAAFSDFKEENSAVKASTPTQQPKKIDSPKEETQQTQTTQHEVTQENKRIFVSPVAKKVAGEHNVNLGSISGTGPSGRIIKQDIIDHVNIIKHAPAQVSAPTQHSSSVDQSEESPEFTDIELTQMRKVIAERLLFSKTTIPHFYISVDIEMDNIIKLREKINKHAKVKISLNDIVIKAASLAAIRYPDVNSSWMGNSIRRYKNVDMSVAVQTEIGLLTPIIFSSNLKGLEQISTEMKSLAERAKAKKLKLNEFQGGTFTISNMGMFGINNFSAIINPPQACILAVGTTTKKVLFDETSQNKEAPFRIASVMSCTLSCDHRVVDGVLGAHWVNEFKRLMETPELMLL